MNDPTSLAHSTVFKRNSGVDLASYCMSEKLDGIRAIWTGGKLYFRSGREIKVPATWVSGFPNQSMEGELYIGRGKFNDVGSTVRKLEPVLSEWERVKFVLFDLPDEPGSFEERHAKLQQLSTMSPQLAVIETTDTPTTEAELLSMLSALMKKGGEGYMLHKRDAPYVVGRSTNTLKLKGKLDTEGVVFAHVAGKGKHEGRLGAVMVRMKNGVEFKLGTGFTDAVRENPPPIGCKVTFEYRELTPSGKPRFASFVRIRGAE